MGINIDVVQQIGMFDEKSFSRGYGEENDWCMRAHNAGYKNVLVPDLFVAHKHGGSFETAEKLNLQKTNFDVLVKKHPEYPGLIQKFIGEVSQTIDKLPTEEIARSINIIQATFAGKAKVGWAFITETKNILFKSNAEQSLKTAA